LWTKASALLHSLVNNHPFVDGNERVGWIVATTFLYHNDAVTAEQIAKLNQDAAYDLVIAVTEGRLTEVDPIANRLRSFYQAGPMARTCSRAPAR
jgi:death-on-curing protein